jgi:hypothetical protein
MGAGCASKTLKTTYNTTQLHNLDDHNLNSPHCKNLKSHFDKTYNIRLQIFVLALMKQKQGVLQTWTYFYTNTKGANSLTV